MDIDCTFNQFDCLLLIILFLNVQSDVFLLFPHFTVGNWLFLGFGLSYIFAILYINEISNIYRKPWRPGKWVTSVVWQCAVDSLSHTYKTGLTTKLPLLNATKHCLNSQMRPVLRHHICPCSISVTFNIWHICDTYWKSKYLVEQKGDVALFETEGKIGSCFQTVTLSCGQVWLNDKDSLGLEEKQKWLRIGDNVLSCGITKCHRKRVVLGRPFTLIQHTTKKELKLACKKTQILNSWKYGSDDGVATSWLRGKPRHFYIHKWSSNRTFFQQPFCSKMLGYYWYFQWY